MTISLSSTDGSRRNVLRGAAAAAVTPMLANLAGCAGADRVAPARAPAQNAKADIPRRQLGQLEVSGLGFGCMNIAWAYGPAG